MFGLLAGGGWWLHAANSSEPTAADQRVLSVLTVRLEQSAQFERQRSFLGEVQSTRSSRLGFEVPGAISIVSVREGEAVAAGQVLAQLDTARLTAARAEAAAGLREAKAAEQLARSTLDRFTRAHAANAISGQQLDEASRQLDRQSAAVGRAAAQVERLDVDIAKSTLRAPYAGRLQRRLADEGTVVSAGQPVFEILEDGTPEVRFAVESNLAREVDVGMIFAGSSRRQESIELQISRVLPGRDDRTRAVAVFAEPLNSEDLREGDLIEVVVTQPEDQSGFWVPLTALTESARGLWSCYIAEPIEGRNAHRIVRREIEILSLQGEQAYVTGNLSQDEALVADGLHRIVPGQTVRLTDAI
ncbi:MAG: efflux RND transporter periplasmic adaptor subunit [Synoicihabitans sp.]